MPRALSPRSRLDTLKLEARRWLKALRAGDPESHARLARALERPPADPHLRDVQLALAREHGLAGWTALRDAVVAIERAREAPDPARDEALAALLHAAGRGDVDRVVTLLDARPDLVNARAELPGNTGLRTALHYGSGHLEVVRALLARGADPNVRDEGDNACPLHFVVERGDVAVAQLLLAHGADARGEGDWHDLDVIGWATVFGSADPALVALLFAHGARHNILSATAVGDVEAIAEIVRDDRPQLERRMEPPHAGCRPLHLAVAKRQPRALDQLLALGADPDATDASGLTPLDLAALAGATDMVERLFASGAHVALPAAVALDRTDDVARLLREEPGALRPGARWGTLIVRAAERASGATIEALVREGGDVHVRDDPGTAIDGARGYTALHAAAWHGNLDAAQSLVRLGADVNARESRYAGTPAGWAAHAGHAAMRDFLLAGDIDLFTAVDFDLAHRVAGIVARHPEWRGRPFGEWVAMEERAERWWPAADMTPLAWAEACGRAEVARALRETGS